MTGKRGRGGEGGTARAARPLAAHEGRLKEALAELAQCSVCMDTVVEPHALRGCGHAFCGACIDA